MIRRWRAALLALALAGASAPPAITARTTAPPRRTPHGYLNARVPWSFAFPRDHAAHAGFQSEWWYYTGHLRAADGRRFGYELTFFRYALRPGGDPPPAAGRSRWRSSYVYPAHFALTDVEGKRFVFDQRFARGALGLGRASERTLDVAAGGWWLRGSSPFHMHATSASVGTLDLSQTAEKPPIAHGRDGVSLKAACATCASHYYSMTRLRTTGTLVYGGMRLKVTGLSWMDHEFGSDELQRDVVGWDWFSIQLDDRRELMDYRLRRAGGTIVPESSGTLVDPAGRPRTLPLSGIETAALGSWRSSRTGAVYPSGWRVRVPSARLDLTLVPVLRDQELANTAGGVSYWEGAVDVSDTGTGRPLGRGYVELTGYARAIAL